jgi:glycosyltransferase involved in cell wall biosynthesis
MTQTRQICHINVARGYRGGERQTELLIRELAERGVSQALVCRRGAPLSQRLRDVAVEIREVSGNPIGVFAATRGVDLLHVHEGRSVYSAYVRARWSGTPYIITRRVNNPIRDHRWAHRTYRSASWVAAVAPQVAEIVRQFDPAIQVTVIHSGSSSLRVDPRNVAAIRERFAGKFVVGHVGALDNAQKGQEYIIAVARMFAVSEPDIHFCLVGGGSDEGMLRELAAGLDNLTFIGFVDNVGDYLAAFDVFILPSNREGIGSILFDAMERRLPIVASRVGGVPDIVHDGLNGYLIEAGKADQLRDAILRLRRNPDVCHAFGEYGVSVARQFTAATMCEKYLELYREVLHDASLGTSLQ